MAKWRNTMDSYGIIAQAMHWLVAAMVLVQLALGVYAADLPVSLARLQWLSRHKSLGLAILAVIVFRAAWRSMHRPPALPESMSFLQQRAARIAHWSLYALLVLAPLTGWLHASAAGLSVNWFGFFQVPDLISQNPALSEWLKGAHKTCVALLALLITGHAGAALWHAFVLRDGVLRRMLPWKSGNNA